MKKIPTHTHSRRIAFNRKNLLFSKVIVQLYQQMAAQLTTTKKSMLNAHSQGFFLPDAKKNGQKKSRNSSINYCQNETPVLIARVAITSAYD